MDLIWKINNGITIYLNDLILNNHLEDIVWFFSDGPIFFLPVFFVGAWLFFTFKKRDNLEKENILLIFYTIIIWFILNFILKIFIVEHRPETLIQPILKHIPDNSFPSDHATASFAFLFWLYFAGYKRIFWIFLPFVIFMNFSRIAGGVHWFFDVFVWMILWVIAVFLVFKNKENKFVKKINEFILKIANLIKL